MGTRARVGMMLPEGRIISIYTHWDGYPEHHGPILKNHYSKHNAIKQLMTLGDLSILGERLGVKCDFDAHPHPADQCISYSRDRGEDAPAREDDDLKSFVDFGAEQAAEWFYLFDGAKWLCSQGGDYNLHKWRDLSDVLASLV